jgi:pilus assembly protein Flp/PilA
MEILFSGFVAEERKQDLIDYALLAGLISVVSITAITTLGLNIQTKYSAIVAAVTAAGAAAS